MKKTILAIVVMVIIAISSLYIKVDLEPPVTTRVILELDRQTYITPPCFESANATNYIDETTLEEAKEMGFKPDSTCTEESLEPESVSVWKWLLITVGFGENKWDW